MTLAKHLAICERKSAYSSEENAKAATATHSMLDVLGLMRKPEEPAAQKESGNKSKKDAVVGKEAAVEVSSEADKRQDEPMDVDENAKSECETVVENSIENDSSAVNDDKSVTDNVVASEAVQESSES